MSPQAKPEEKVKGGKELKTKTLVSLDFRDRIWIMSVI